MGLFGGGSKSSNVTNTTNTITTGQSHIDGDNAGAVLSGVRNAHITLTDNGAVSAALRAMTDTSGEAIAANEAVSKMSFAFGRDVVTEAFSSSEGATHAALDVAKNLSLSSDQGTAQQLGKYMTFSMVALAVALIFKGKF